PRRPCATPPADRGARSRCGPAHQESRKFPSGHSSFRRKLFLLTGRVKTQNLIVTVPLVVGIDAGATSTRVSVHTLDGSRAGYARAGAGNPTAHGLDKAVAAITGALREALSGLDASRVIASLAGVAGHVEQMAPGLAAAWAGLGVPSAPRLTGDVQIAFSAGSHSPDGSLLLSGTGAVAAAIRSHRLHRIAD